MEIPERISSGEGSVYRDQAHTIFSGELGVLYMGALKPDWRQGLRTKDNE
jgi:hypothetical protein